MKMWVAISMLLLSFSAFSQEADETPKIESYRKQCLEIAVFSKPGFDISCHYNYHHFNSQVSKYYAPEKAMKNGEVKIAEFNVLHPGTAKSKYKDFEIVAKIINQWDVIAVTELLPLVSSDLKHNNALVKFVEEAPAKIAKYEHDLAIERVKPRPNASKVRALEMSIKSLSDDLKRAPGLYRSPGYLKILKALHQLPGGKEWSLILSPKGEAAKDTDVQELVGFYYRSSAVKPEVNNFCKTIKTLNQGSPYACLVPMGPGFMGKDYRTVFSRRPFMSSFQSGNFSFTLLASHVVFNSPTDSDNMGRILDLAFKVRDLGQLGTGINKQNYARFAEVKLTLDFMQRLRDQLKMKNLIYAGDLNLEANNKFWPEVLKSFKGGQVFSADKSSVSEKRFNSKGLPTNGGASDYDHFIFSPQENGNCLQKSGELNGGVDVFYNGPIGALVKNRYLVRIEASRGPYQVNSSKYSKLIKDYLGGYESGKKREETFGKKSLSDGETSFRVDGIIDDSSLMNDYLSFFTERVLDSQLSDESYYGVFKQVISDHMPIYMGCSNN